MAIDSSNMTAEHDGKGLVIEYGKEDQELSVKQKLFCAEYVKCLNGTLAATRAGYSAHTATVQASQLLTRLNIQNEVQRLADKRLERCGVSVEYVLNGIVETIERCMQARPVLTKKGEQVTEYDPETGEVRPVYQFDASNVLKGKELLGRYLKMFSDKTEHAERYGAPLAQITINTDPETAARIYKDMIER